MGLRDIVFAASLMLSVGACGKPNTKADLDKDNLPDKVYADCKHERYSQITSCEVIVNYANGKKVVIDKLSNGVTDVSTTDLDGDGNLDVVVTAVGRWGPLGADKKFKYRNEGNYRFKKQ